MISPCHSKTRLETVCRIGLMLVLLWSAAGLLASAVSAQANDVPSDPLARLVDEFAEIYKQGRYAEAAEVAARILAVLQETRGPEDLDLAANLNNLGSLAYAQGKLDLAQPFYRGSLAIYEKQTGPNSASVADLLYNLGGLLLETGKSDEAVALYDRCLAIRRSVLGPKHPLVAEVLNNLGFVYLSQQRLQKADAVFIEAFNIWKDNIGTEAPYAAVTLTNLGQLRARQKRYEEAVSMFEQALDVERQVFGPSHPELATTLSALARAYVQQGKKDQAIETYREAGTVLDETVGPADPLTVQVKNQIAALTGGRAPQTVSQHKAGQGEYGILLVRTQQEVAELHARITAGESFEDLAREHSVDPSSALGGMLRADPADLSEDLRAQLALLAPGTVSQVFALRRQWAIVKKVRDP